MHFKHLRIKRGDIDGFLGLLVDNLSVFLLLISLNLFVVGMPAGIVFGRILPGAAIGLLGGNIYYTYMAVRMAKVEGRSDVTALPCGISIVFVITYTMGILLPVTRITGDPEMAWRICLAANLIGAAICVIGALIGPAIRNFLPTASMLGPLAGLAVVFIAGAGLKDVISNPIVGFLALAVVVWCYIAKGRLPFEFPAGLMALLIGGIIAFAMGQTSVEIEQVGMNLPQFWIFKVGPQAFKECLPYLSIIIPVAIINFITTLNDVESAASVGDKFSIRESMLIDAGVSALGAVFGCCYPNCVFIGHPGYKRMGAGTTYSLLNGIAVSLLAVFGLFALINSMIPLAAVTPILIFVGVINIENAFTAVPKTHIPAVSIAILPYICEFGKEQIDAGLEAVGIAAPFSQDVLTALSGAGINYSGYTLMAHGTIIISMLLAAIVVFVMERRLFKASIAAGVGTLCTFVGLMHSSQLALNPNPELTAAWFLITVITLIGGFMYKIKPENV